MAPLDPSVSCTFVQPNPKLAGSASARRYALYSKGKTIGEALKLGAAKGDLTNDIAKKYLFLGKGIAKAVKVKVEAPIVNAVRVPAKKAAVMKAVKVPAMTAARVDQSAPNAVEPPRTPPRS